MQNKLDPLITFYIETTFLEDNKKDLYYSFALLENFSVNFYQDTLLDLLTDEDSYSSDDRQDLFYNDIKTKMKNIILEHNITLDNDVTISLNEINELVHFLYIIQILEDYSYISYRLYAQDTPTNIVIDLMSHLTLLSKHRLMEVIKEVDVTLIKSIQLLIEDKEKDSISLITKHQDTIKAFMTFTENHECLGNTFYRDGYTNVTLEELSNLLTFNLYDHLDIVTMKDPAKASLDILSILILCKDTYELPLLMFKKHYLIFTSKYENLTKLEHIITNILVDFNTFHSESKKNFTQVEHKEIVNE